LNRNAEFAPTAVSYLAPPAATPWKPPRHPSQENCKRHAERTGTAVADEGKANAATNRKRTRAEPTAEWKTDPATNKKANGKRT
jgi:hypothetical protein